MIDTDWELAYPGTEYTFGSRVRPVFNATTPDLGDYQIDVADEAVARGDGINFGVDFFRGRTITFDLAMRGLSEADVRAHGDALAAVWRANVVRRTPGAVAELRSRYRASERVVFGRPRRMALNTREAATGLLITAVADFKAADDKFYSAAEQVLSVALVPTPSGGLVSPLASPLATTANSNRAVGINLGGELPTWLTLEIDGPLTNPLVTVGDLRWELNMTIPENQTLVIDSRPWARTVLLNGSNAAGKFIRTSTRLSDSELEPGSYGVSFGGTSATGTAQLRLKWREAFSTP